MNEQEKVEKLKEAFADKAFTEKVLGLETVDIQCWNSHHCAPIQKGKKTREGIYRGRSGRYGQDGIGRL